MFLVEVASELSKSNIVWNYANPDPANPLVMFQEFEIVSLVYEMFAFTDFIWKPRLDEGEFSIEGYSFRGMASIVHEVLTLLSH